MSYDEEPRRELAFVPAAHVRSERVEWLMEPWIPRRSLTLLAGREGLGKSTIAVDIAARATRGELDNRNPLRVLYLATEDSRSMTVKPRLVAAGADLDAVGFLDVTLGEYGGSLSLPHDYPLLSELIVSERIGLVVLDAAKSAMSSTLNDHRDDDVRRFLEPMSKMADDFDVVFVALVHFGKRASTDSGTLILGSIAWSQVARSVLSVARDDESGTLIVTNTKGNLAPREMSKECAIASARVPVDEGGHTTAGVVEWRGESKRSARELLGGQGDDGTAAERSAAEGWLEDFLTLNPGTASQEVKNEARKYGHSERTLQRAAKALNVQSREEGFPRRTYWSLGPSDATAPPSAHNPGANGATSPELHKRYGVNEGNLQSRHTVRAGTTATPEPSLDSTEPIF